MNRNDDLRLSSANDSRDRSLLQQNRFQLAKTIHLWLDSLIPSVIVGKSGPVSADFGSLH